MNPKLNYVMAQHRSAELRRGEERARLASEVPARRGIFGDRNTTTRPCSGPRRGMTALKSERAVGGTR
jgi:hypothetical protein